ncbi:MAG: hypothetical protein HQM06_00520 [Magnetococcales bacterium]|nr:hypothetical protein [Magnetococcales bacterium]
MLHSKASQESGSVAHEVDQARVQRIIDHYSGMTSSVLDGQNPPAVEADFRDLGCRKQPILN